MTKLGIIGAMQIEVELLKEKMEDLTVTVHAGMEFYLEIDSAQSGDIIRGA